MWFLSMITLFSLQALFFIPAVRKAGFSPWWVAVALIPGVGILLLWVFAFAEWPVETDAGIEPAEIPEGMRIANIVIAVIAVGILLLSIPMVSAMASLHDNKELWQNLGGVLAIVTAVILIKRNEFALLGLFFACAFFFVSCAANFHWAGG